MTRWQKTATRVCCCAALFGLVGGCRREQPKDTATAASGSGPAKSNQADLLQFPDELHVADPALNEFVTRAMTTCAKGDYEPFRLLWSAREDPLPRAEYEEGWHAVETIVVRALEKVLLAPDPKANRAEGETVYALLVDVSLDPTQKAGQKKPERHVAMMLTRESDEWRLARAPKAMRAWIKEKIAGGTGPPEPPRKEHTD